MDELPPHARALLDAVKRSDDPTAAERERSDDALRAVLAKHGVRDLPPLYPGEAAAGLTRAPLTSRAWLAFKLGASALAFVAAVYLGARLVRPEAQPARSQPSAAAAPNTTPPPLRASTAEPTSAPAAHAPDRPVVIRERAPVLERSAGELAAPPPETPRARARQPGHPTDDVLENELRTIAAVNDLLRRDKYRDALRLLNRTDAQSADVLREERTALRILAQCGLAPNPSARRERDAFLRSSPQSVLADRVRNACASQPGDSP